MRGKQTRKVGVFKNRPKITELTGKSLHAQVQSASSFHNAFKPKGYMHALSCVADSEGKGDDVFEPEMPEIIVYPPRYFKTGTKQNNRHIISRSSLQFQKSANSSKSEMDDSPARNLINRKKTEPIFETKINDPYSAEYIAGMPGYTSF